MGTKSEEESADAEKVGVLQRVKLESLELTWKYLVEY